MVESLPLPEAFAEVLKKKTKLAAAGKRLQFAFLGSGDPDDLDRLRKQYREANANQPLWDESGPIAVTAFASALQQPGFAQELSSLVERKLGSRSAKNWRARAAANLRKFRGSRAGESSRPEESVTALNAKAAAQRLAAGRSVTRRLPDVPLAGPYSIGPGNP
jgi:hypothetical protein